MNGTSPSKECVEENGVLHDKDVQTLVSTSPQTPLGNSGFWRKLKEDRIYRKNFMHSMSLALAFFSLGMYIGQHGPTNLDLQIITNTGLEEASAFFTGGNAGYMAGSILTGLIYDKMNKPLLLFLMTLCLGLFNILVPFCSKFELMIFMRFVVGIFGGGIDTGGNADHMRVWGTEADGIMQFLHFCYSFGGVISPLYTEPFLAERSHLEKNETSSNISLPSSNATLTLPNQTETRVQYVYIITGIFVTLTSIPFLFITIRERRKSGDKKQGEKRKLSQREVPFPILILMLAGVGLFYFMYCSVEDTFFSFLMAFLVGEFESVSKSRGAFTTAIAWASFAGARFLMIFVSKLLTPLRLLVVMTISMSVAFSCFAAFAYIGAVDALVFFTALSAISMSGVFPAGFSWMESRMFRVTGGISSWVLVSSSLGSVLNPLVIGYLMEEYDTMWFCYLLLIEAFVLVCVLVSMIIFTECYVDRKYGSMGTSETEVTGEVIGEDDETEVETETIFLPKS